jgi:hypothetical protein
MPTIADTLNGGSEVQKDKGPRISSQIQAKVITHSSQLERTVPEALPVSKAGATEPGRA